MNKGHIFISLLTALVLFGSAFLVGYRTTAVQAGVNGDNGNGDGWTLREWVYNEEPVGECVSEVACLEGEGGLVEGSQQWQVTRTCELSLFGHDHCTLGETEVVETWTDECRVEVPACEEEPQPTPTPTEEPKPSEPVASTITPGNPPPPNECTEGEQAPATPQITSVARLDGDSVVVNWAKQDGVSHYVLQYGRSYTDLPYGIGYINGDSQGVTIDGVWSDSHVFGRLIAEGSNNCQSSVLFDP